MDAGLMEKMFTTLFRNNLWLSSESVSGSGSSKEQTKWIIPQLEKIIEAFDVKTILDAPCGDYNWMRFVSFPIDLNYIGCDIVKELIEQTRLRYGSDKVKFIQGDICTNKLPKSDLIFCRDCLVHLSYEDIKRAIKNFKESGSTYLLTTTFTNRTHNSESVLINANEGLCGWQPINLRIAPFNFPEPILVLNEKCSEGGTVYADKSLGLWKLSDL